MFGMVHLRRYLQVQCGRVILGELEKVDYALVLAALVTSWRRTDLARSSDRMTAADVV